MKLSTKDQNLLDKKGISVKKIEQQVEIFKTGLPFINLKRAATVDDGILKLNDAEKDQFISLYDSSKENIDIVKFVPASGAATRMFKFLFQFLKSYQSKDESINAYINRKKALDISLFFIGLEKLPFYNDVIQHLKNTKPHYSQLTLEEQRIEFVKALLEENQLLLDDPYRQIYSKYFFYPGFF